ncbi:hypothetical protein HBB16_04930 [Pseudonocardia sp. MCCB 268]|nr:hypothetical protein [Pseudonocardia cytotoxica]
MNEPCSCTAAHWANTKGVLYAVACTTSQPLPIRNFIPPRRGNAPWPCGRPPPRSRCPTPGQSPARIGPLRPYWIVTCPAITSGCSSP